MEKKQRTTEKDEINFGRISPDALVLHILMDGSVHAYQEIADKLEYSKMTIRRSVSRLGLYFDIHILKGGSGDSKGGVYLDEQHLHLGLTKEKVCQKRKRKGN